MNTIKILVISDSHGNKQMVNLFLEQAAKYNPDLIYHLGDYYDDANLILDAGYPCVRVPGTWTSYYKDFRVENRKVEIVNDWKIYLTHTPTIHFNDLPDDSDPEEMVISSKIDVMLHGHTHIYKVEKKNKVLIINPGHTKAKLDKGKPASFAKLEISKVGFQTEIINLHSKDVLITHFLTK
mgnify:CR=1 FL=1